MTTESLHRRLLKISSEATASVSFTEALQIACERHLEIHSSLMSVLIRE
jgi:hypothetical protein